MARGRCCPKTRRLARRNGTFSSALPGALEFGRREINVPENAAERPNLECPVAVDGDGRLVIRAAEEEMAPPDAHYGEGVLFDEEADEFSAGRARQLTQT